MAGHVKKRISTRTGKTTWQARVPNPAHPSKHVVKTFDRRKDAEHWLTQQVAALDRGDWQDPRSAATPFRELVETWEQTRAAQLAPRTRERYSSIVRKYLLPAFGSTPVGSLTRGDIKRYFAALDTSPGTARKVQIVLSSILSEGVELGLLRENPGARMRLATPPRRHMTVLTDVEVRALAEAVTRPSDRLAVYVAAYTGLRAGELWALRVRDVDLGRRTLRVERTLTTENGALIFRDATKTEGSRRTVSLPTFLANMLAAAQPTNPSPDALLFTAPGGGNGRKVGDPDNAVRHELFRRRVYNPARRALPAAKQGITWHDLRHTCASLLINRGANILLVARHLGHADPSMTLKVYGHLYPSHEAALADALDAGFNEAAETVVPLRAAG